MWAVTQHVQNIWPFSAFIFNELRASDRIVKKLPIPETTKHFVYAIREPELEAVIYVLSVQNLSERSSLDAECLIRAIKPDAVVVQVGELNGEEMSGLRQDGNGCKVGDDDTVPTSVFEVLKKCFMHKISRERYEDVAGTSVLKEIFGVSFNGHLIAAKNAAEEVGSSFVMLESPFVKCNMSGDSDSDLETEAEVVNSRAGFGTAISLQLSNLVPQRIGSSVVSLSSRVFRATDEVQSQMVRSLSSYLVSVNPASKFSGGDVTPIVDYEVPQFAKYVYPLLVDLHDMFVDIPSMGTALACAQKMLCDVSKGETIDNHLLSEVYAFQIAVEGLRIAFNNAGRLIRNSAPPHCEFSDLPMDDKSHAILAQALRSQSKKYRSIVAVVDASGLAGLRKHWKTNVPLEVEGMVDQLVINYGDNGELSTRGGFRNRLLADKPVVAVGAGATVAIGASSLSKVIPASTFIKIATFHAPASLKLVFTQTQKALLFTLSKTLGPTKVVAPGMVSSSMKGSVIKAAASAEKIRAVAHGVIASVEKTSLSAMRTAFYEIMRKRQLQRIGVLPWATFGCSMATCSGLLVYGDGIECAAESFPAAPSIACLGRGIQSLRQVSQVVREAESSRIQRSIESLLHKFRKLKLGVN